MSKIQHLSDKTISQIAAGEIIENPASVCKELLENSIDAGAKKILIQLGDELIDFIRITDDGEGIIKEDIPIAFQRHATSKLKNIKDLDHLFSLGFRGEALASIASISEIELVTKIKDDELGYKANVIDGKVIEMKPIGAPNGTSILIKNLFYNTPVRKKYLKSLKIELENILRELETIALSNNNISIHVSHKSKTILQSHASDKRINHIYSILGKDIATNLIPIQFNSESYKIEGYISNNNLYRSNAQREYIFINGRSVRSIEISQKIRSLYHTLIPLQKYPVFILYLEIDPILIDVNVHPQKQYVRISNENNVLDILEKLIKNSLYSNRNILDIQLNKKENTGSDKDNTKEETIFEYATRKREENISSEKYSEYSEAQFNTLTSIEKVEKDKYENNTKVQNSLIENNNFENFIENINGIKENSVNYENILNLDENTSSLEPFNIDFWDYQASLFKTYLVFEDKSNSALFLVDQHAAHERILFEKYYSDLVNENVNSQVLLTPLILNLSPVENIKLYNHLSEYKKLGFSIDEFGDRKFVLREVPVSILISNHEQFIHDSLFELEDGIEIVEKNLYKVMRLACRSAIKAGDVLDSVQAMNLIQDLNDCRNPFTCPHGRPTIIKIEKKTIEKLFLREG